MINLKLKILVVPKEIKKNIIHNNNIQKNMDHVKKKKRIISNINTKNDKFIYFQKQRDNFFFKKFFNISKEKIIYN